MSIIFNLLHHSTLNSPHFAFAIKMASNDTPSLCKDAECSVNQGEIEILPESSFFKEGRAAALPSAQEVRAISIESGSRYSEKSFRTDPVIIFSLGLIIKWGENVTYSEFQTQLKIREQLQGQVPIPEVFGWAKDGIQGFIYMALMEGDTLEDRWLDLSEDERLAVCEELRGMTTAWRVLEQDQEGCYIGMCLRLIVV